MAVIGKDKQTQEPFGEEKTRAKKGTKTKKSNADLGGFEQGEGIGAQIQLPRFMPEGMADLGLCTSEDQLNEVKQMLADFKQVYQWTKQKFNQQMKAADLAVELAKSQNQMVAHFAKACMKQAKSDSELNALLGALPQMIGAIHAQTPAKKEKKVRDFTERLAKAGKS